MWVDASIQICVDINKLIERHVVGADLAVFKYPHSDCVYALTRSLIDQNLEPPQPALSQMHRYGTENFPAHAGVTLGGVLLRRHCPAIERFNEAWWQEYKTGSRRDMLSLDYCIWTQQIRASYFDGDLYNSDKLRFLAHRHGRSRSEFDVAEWARLPFPRALENPPFDLSNTALEYGGIYRDGWLETNSFLSLEQPAASNHLVVRGMIPLIDDADFTLTLRLSVDGHELVRRELGLGEFELSVPLWQGPALRRIDLRSSRDQRLPESAPRRDQRLPEPVPRRVAARIEFIGFAEVA
jgi:hypothetical protein